VELLGAARAQTSGLARCHGAAGELQNGSADASGSHQRPQADVSNPTRQRAFELSFWRGVRNAAVEPGPMMQEAGLDGEASPSSRGQRGAVASPAASGSPTSLASGSPTSRTKDALSRSFQARQ